MLLVMAIWSAMQSVGGTSPIPGFTAVKYREFHPLESVDWCQKCCKEKVATCDSCFKDDLVSDMVRTRARVNLARCARGDGPTTWKKGHY